MLDFFDPLGTFYEDMQECSWLIQVEKDHLISLEFLAFAVSYQNLLLKRALLYLQEFETKRAIISKVRNLTKIFDNII